MKYYDTTTKTGTNIFRDLDTTILSDDTRVVDFFKPLPTGFKLEFTTEGLPLIVEIPSLTEAELLKQKEDSRIASITAEADSIIEASYTPRKQRKLSSIAIALLDKRGLTSLTTEEETLLQSCRDVNTWITSIRTIENEVIVGNTLLADIDWWI